MSSAEGLQNKASAMAGGLGFESASLRKRRVLEATLTFDGRARVVLASPFVCRLSWPNPDLFAPHFTNSPSLRLSPLFHSPSLRRLIPYPPDSPLAASNCEGHLQSRRLTILPGERRGAQFGCWKKCQRAWGEQRSVLSSAVSPLDET